MGQCGPGGCATPHGGHASILPSRKSVCSLTSLAKASKIAAKDRRSNVRRNRRQMYRGNWGARHADCANRRIRGGYARAAGMRERNAAFGDGQGLSGCGPRTAMVRHREWWDQDLRLRYPRAVRRVETVADRGRLFRKPVLSTAAAWFGRPGRSGPGRRVKTDRSIGDRMYHFRLQKPAKAAVGGY